jgi:hypothetical protein
MVRPSASVTVPMPKGCGDGSDERSEGFLVHLPDFNLDSSRAGAIEHQAGLQRRCVTDFASDVPEKDGIEINEESTRMARSAFARCLQLNGFGLWPPNLQSNGWSEARFL